LTCSSEHSFNNHYYYYYYFRPAFAPLYPNQYHHQHSTNLASSQHNQWNSSSSQHYGTLHHNHHHHLQNNKRDLDGMSTSSSRKEKRQYKKRKHKAPRESKPSKDIRSIPTNVHLNSSRSVFAVESYDGFFSSDEEDIHNQMVASESEDDGSAYPFRRNKNCDYYKVCLLPLSQIAIVFIYVWNKIRFINFSRKPIVLVIGHGNLVRKMELPIRNIVSH
jgi:hypothetical protein